MEYYYSTVSANTEKSSVSCNIFICLISNTFKDSSERVNSGRYT